MAPLRTLILGYRHCPLLKICSAKYSTTPYNEETLSLTMRQGYPVLSLPLPSKRESCDFTLRPHLHTVGDLTQFIQAEDKGVDNVTVYSAEGNRVAKSTGLDILLFGDFDLKINDFMYRIKVPEESRFGLDGEQSLGDVKNMVQKIYTSLNVDSHQLSKELELRGQLEQLQSDLAPLELQREAMEKSATARSNLWVWGGMAWMSVQFGFFARLTWWEYSWDIMEPVTYFVTYGTSMVFFAYFILTRQEFMYPDAKDRVHLNHFYKVAQKNNFDISRYNHLKEAVEEVQGQIDRLRDPLQLNLPTPPPKRLQHEP